MGFAERRAQPRGLGQNAGRSMRSGC